MNILVLFPLLFFLCTIFAGYWYKLVSAIVPAPYLDEVFHLRQAQAYCDGKLSQWDPKITTPPGLYVLSIPLRWVGDGCTVYNLRAVNMGLLGAVGIVAHWILELRRANGTTPRNSLTQALNDAHSAFNITLFPLLFFFSGLYYTDIASTLLVLSFYWCYMAESSKAKLFSPSQIAWALCSLTIRQTNIFWVAVFPAGLTVISTLQHSPAGARRRDSESLMQLSSRVLKQAWTEGSVYDPPIIEATLEDYLLTTASIIVATLRNLRRVVPALLQYGFILGIFACFVLWNGGVVLGDKSNHVATIHLPQMLYIWPYFVFFSFPLMLPSALRLALHLLSRAPGLSPRSKEAKTNLPRLCIFAAFSAIAALVIRVNTIVHPFTLADNRHYMFYVFRILLRNGFTKYGAAPTYVLCAYLSINALGGSEASEIPRKEEKCVKKGQDIAKQTATRSDGSCNASFVIVWLASTALSLVTAPLVEPRYFIIPWVVWRLHVPAYRFAATSGRNPTHALQEHDHRLWLETLWFFAINAATGYMFLYRGFSWPQEPGNIQRFMW
ncbi:hypothetical protein NA57DRAFT_37047 [Rhizodiscina lignyota]|uniref:Dol-P-Glc:Glc(2)Man(9)GlcNAc(2)-PP-Dol alpha-1,2-glucosyltransferase n=1 Tax=Rhizodiscina lignyota TaxID=1504668 RepID=A0A9P4MCX4_9PEZI|nr:hypothetical protein NA57DRAFT_37047 [Rhizodiscina lignyota]